ncbi:MAG: hypothetical protein M3Z24_15410 [Chloroflexota bacterium]|nr:hypothetical protein [Chloroflexota bacterium]
MEPNALMITLKIKGYAKPDVLAAVLDLPKQDVDLMLTHLTEEQLVEQAKLGFKLTAAGQKAAHTAMVAERSQVAASDVQRLYEQFDGVNKRFKALVVAWQMRSSDGKSVPNDHSDAGYDQALLAELGTIDSEIALIVGELAASIPRLARYTTRFEEALRHLHGGELRYMAAPLIDSYHTVWFELHEDLIFLVNTTRAEEAAHGRAV